MTEAEVNKYLGWGAMGLRVAAIFCPALVPFAALASTASSVAPEVESALSEIEGKVAANGGVVTGEHLTMIQAMAEGLQVYSDAPA